MNCLEKNPNHPVWSFFNQRQICLLLNKEWPEFKHNYWASGTVVRIVYQEDSLNIVDLFEIHLSLSKM